MCPHHVSSRINPLPDDVINQIILQLKECLPPPTIINIVKANHNITLTAQDLYKYRVKALHSLLDETHKTPYGTRGDHLIQHLKKDR